MSVNQCSIMWLITFTPYVRLTLHSYYLPQSFWWITTLFFPKCLSLPGSPTCSLRPSYWPFSCLLNQSKGPLQKHISTVDKKIIPHHKPPCILSLHDLGLSSFHTQDIFHSFADWRGSQDLMLGKYSTVKLHLYKFSCILLGFINLLVI